MKLDNIKNVLIVGAGTMGQQISSALPCARPDTLSPL